VSVGKSDRVTRSKLKPKTPSLIYRLAEPLSEWLRNSKWTITLVWSRAGTLPRNVGPTCLGYVHHLPRTQHRSRRMLLCISGQDAAVQHLRALGAIFCPSWDPLRVQFLVTTTTSAGRRDASVRLPRTPRGTVGTQPRGGLGAFWGASGPSNAMTCHSPTEAAPARDVCAVTDCWDALAWLGEMTLAARNVCWAIDGRWPRITRRIDGLK
jgi:hypothetical protein